jgi:hypothetical protein
MPFVNRFRDTLLLPSRNVVTKICGAPPTAYPAGGVTIMRTPAFSTTSFATFAMFLSS